MPNLELEQHIAAVRMELEACDSANYAACAPSVVHLKAVMAAFDKQGADLEQVTLSYVALLKAVIPLVFYARAVVATARPGKHGRAYVAQEAADELAKAVKAYGRADSANRVLEQPPVIVTDQPETKEVK